MVAMETWRPGLERMRESQHSVIGHSSRGRGHGCRDFFSGGLGGGLQAQDLEGSQKLKVQPLDQSWLTLR